MIRMMMVGAAALALAAPVAAKPDNGHGKDHGKHERGNDRGKEMKRSDARGEKSERRMVRAERGGSEKAAKRYDDRKGRDFDRDDRKMAKREMRADRDDDRRYAERRYDDRRDDDRRYDDRDLVRVDVDRRYDDCPPGLAKKNNGCLPPGQAKKMLGTRVAPQILAAALPGAYDGWYRDDPRYLWRANDDYLYRIDRETNLISGLMPRYSTGYYPVGEAYPTSYNFYNVPMQYRTLYPSQADYLYRYNDGAIYALDPTTNLVNSIVALVTGDLAVGQALPPAYSVYNVPLSYRDQYADTANDWYRYNDGYIYRVDPTTQLISAIVKAVI